MSDPHSRPRLLLVDDHPALLRQVARFLSEEFEVVGTVADGSGLHRLVEDHKPDVVVLDMGLPGMSGLDLARRLGGAAGPRIVFLTLHSDPDYVREAAAAGALGYVVKARLASDLVPALRAALDGRRFVSKVVDVEGPSAGDGPGWTGASAGE